MKTCFTYDVMDYIQVPVFTLFINIKQRCSIINTVEKYIAHFSLAPAIESGC